MPLPPPASRAPSHNRTVVFQGYRRDDGLWDIEAQLRDTKSQAFTIPHEGTWQPGQAIHDVSIRLTIDDQLLVHDIAAAMDGIPHEPCPGALPPMQRMIGCRLGPGWRQAIERNLGGDVGCTHLRELLFNMATAAFQTLPSFPAPKDESTPPLHLGKCVGWAFDGPVVERHYPVFFNWKRPPRADAERPTPAAAAPEGSARS